ncbi:hypothetical protein [uncultured Anaeromusa sp.]|uniref:TRAFAC clade GTPase domain-containing protein n=1 Tax=uncultured Anaeromusa sp. TaxID=673273 RepID=UPI0029C9050C|nr:hypothetical protein [uncultured Anaeromusa sp.]
MSTQLDNQDSVEVEGLETREEISPVIPLPLGDALTREQIYSISAAEPATFAVIAGPSGCGKTTLVTSMYQMFLKKPLEQYYFAGSLTLQAFEQRAFLTRIVSNQANPQTQRTPRGSLDSILHLRIWDHSRDKYNNLLLTDFSGEDYNDLSGNVTLAQAEFSVVKAAQVIVLLIDGAKISDNQYRHTEIQKAIHILRTFYDAELINSTAKIVVVISKYDIIHNLYQSKPELKQFVESVPEKICRQIEGVRSRIDFCFVAAMPDVAGDLGTGFGLKKLLNLMISEICNPICKCHPTVVPSSEFNLFNERIQK